MADKKPVFLTQEGKERLEQELVYLKTDRRAQIADEMGRAIAEGDLRENAGYDEARRNMWQNDARIAELEAQYPEEVPRPEHWGGYRLSPDYLEFWQGRPSRLHDRLTYRLQADGSWVIARLAP